MKTLNRRRFLHLAGLGMSALAVQQLLTACGIKSPESTASQGLPQTIPPTSTNPLSPTPSETQTIQPPLAIPDLVIVHGKDPETMVRQGIEAIGGMTRFVKSGADVIIKPNICIGYYSYEYATTTNPWVVAALVRLCLEAGASRVRVMDNPFGGPAEQCYQKSGIADQVINAGGEMEVMQPLKFQKTELPEGVQQKSLSFYQDFLTADTIINVPIPKHHSAAGLTLGMKNLMGTIQQREFIHNNLHESIVDLVTLVKPTLTVIDAVRILMANGPTGGNLNDVKQTDTIAISTDIVAADSYATSLFGKTPADIGYVQKAIDRGIGIGDLSQLKLQEFNADA